MLLPQSPDPSVGFVCRGCCEEGSSRRAYPPRIPLRPPSPSDEIDSRGRADVGDCDDCDAYADVFSGRGRLQILLLLPYPPEKREGVPADGLPAEGGGRGPEADVDPVTEEGLPDESCCAIVGVCDWVDGDAAATADRPRVGSWMMNRRSGFLGAVAELGVLLSGVPRTGVLPAEDVDRAGNREGGGIAEDDADDIAPPAECSGDIGMDRRRSGAGARSCRRDERLLGCEAGDCAGD